MRIKIFNELSAVIGEILPIIVIATVTMKIAEVLYNQPFHATTYLTIISVILGSILLQSPQTSHRGKKLSILVLLPAILFLIFFGYSNYNLTFCLFALLLTFLISGGLDEQK